MNERIRQLAELAKEHADSYDDTGTPIWFQMYNEKFAELIVLRCSTIADFAKLGGVIEPSVMIKEYFGVE